MVCHGQLAARVVRMHGWTSHPWHPALALTEVDPQNSLGPLQERRRLGNSESSADLFGLHFAAAEQ
jgi:hypothetical protein